VLNAVKKIYQVNPEMGLLASMGTVALFLIASQFMMGISLANSLGVVAVLALYTITGSLIWRISTKQRIANLFELIGIGFPIGASLSAAFILAVRTLGFTSAPTALLALCLPIASLLTLAIRKVSIKPENKLTPHRELIAICLAPLIYLSSWSKYTLISLTLTVLLLFLGKIIHVFAGISNLRMRKSFYLVTIILPLICAVVINGLLNPFDSSFTNLVQTAGADVLHDAAQSFGYGRYGFLDFVGQAGIGRKNYPLAFIISGVFSDLINMPRLPVAAISIQVVAGLSLTMLFVAIARKFFATRIPMGLLITLLFAQASFPSPFLTGEYAKVNNLFGLILLLLAIYTLLNSFKLADQSHLIVVFGLFCLLVITKPHHALTLLIFVCARVLIALVARHKHVGLKAHVVLSLFMLFTFYFATETILQVEGALQPIAFSLSPYWLFTGIALIIGRGLASYLFWRKETDNDFIHEFRIAALICFLTSLFLTTVFDGSNNFNYLISASLLLVALVNVKVISDAFSFLFVLKNQKAVWVGSITFISGILLYVGYALFNLHIIRTSHKSLLRLLFGEDIPMVPVFLLICCISGSLLILYHSFRGSSFLELARSTTVVISVVLNLGLFVGNTVHNPIKIMFYELNESRNDFIRSDNVAAAIWIEQNSDVDDIVATNTLCPGVVEAGDLTLGTIGSENQSLECFERNTNMFVAAVTSRRLLIEAPIFGPSGYSLTPETSRRYNLIYELSTDPTAATIMSFRELGVSWLLIDQGGMNSFDWRSLATLRFSVGETIVLSI
jgi:hypothetical protein